MHDAGGNITSDTRSGTAYAYTYNNRNRLNTVTVAASLKGTYTYNAKEQLSIRVTSNMTPSGTTHFIHDLNGNVIAETAGNGPTGATGTVREYIYLPETEIAPAADGRTRVDRPLAVVNAVNTATPATYYVHSLPRRRPGAITLGSSPRASLNRPSCRRQASNRVDDGRGQSAGLGGYVAGSAKLSAAPTGGRSPQHHRPAGRPCAQAHKL
ncbi:MAG: hypothetical protein ABL898_18380 [Hyphomicrobiaceae bacterium]|nr:hypothetical protein [Hyphomicrobiaceae bacterium]